MCSSGSASSFAQIENRRERKIRVRSVREVPGALAHGAAVNGQYRCVVLTGVEVKSLNVHRAICNPE